MKRFGLVPAISVLCILLPAVAPAVAQQAMDPAKEASGEPAPGAFAPRGGCTTVPDDAYDGTVASMTCVATTVGAGIVDDVTVDLGMNHTWIGDLTVKVVSPTGTVSTLQSRAGFAEPADDGTSCCGDSSNLLETSPFNYANGHPTSAEDMGSTILGGSVACQDDALCDYFPFPDTGPGTDLDDFDGEAAAGDWMVCVGDSALGDIGEICSSQVNVTILPGTPTLPWGAMIALIAVLGLLSFIMLRRRSAAS